MSNSGDLDVLDPIPSGAGAIGLLSSDEFTRPTEAFARAMVEASGPRVAVLLCADHRHATLNARHARDQFEPLGAHAFALEIEHNPARGALPEFDLLFIPGGSPADLLACIVGAPLWNDVLERWRAGAAIAGSSAGAMALCTHCMTPRPGDDKPTAWTRGAGPLQKAALAVHATTRSEEWLSAMAYRAPVPVLAIDDATGVVIEHDHAPRIVGDGRAWLVKPFTSA